MANIMGILGGLGQGVSAGVQDLERMEDAKFRKEQQQREREKFAEEKRVSEQIKGLQGETTPAEYDESMSAITKPSQKLSRSQMLARQADIYSASPDRQNQMLGLQLSQAASAAESSDKLKEIQTSYADTVKAINADPNKWVQENLAKFNSDEYGGPGTKGFMAAPMSTPQGTVLNVIGPQGQPGPQIPVTRQDMMRVAKSMYFDQLASIDPKYAELAMQQEKIGLEREGLGLRRQANETDAQFKARQADYYAGRLGLDREELNARIKGGLLSRPPERFEALGLGDNGRTIFGTRGGKEATLTVPEGFEGSFPKLSPKGAAGVDIRKTDEGFIAFNKTTGKPVYNLGSKGQPLPLGISESELAAKEKQAASAGIPLELKAERETGRLVLGYKGRDGEYYDSLEEARKAKPAKK